MLQLLLSVSKQVQQPSPPDKKEPKPFFNQNPLCALFFTFRAMGCLRLDILEQSYLQSADQLPCFLNVVHKQENFLVQETPPEVVFVFWSVRFPNRRSVRFPNRRSVRFPNRRVEIYLRSNNSVFIACRAIQDPYDSRYYDRFAYVLNNPLMNIDPTGEEPLTFAAIVKTLKAIYAIYKAVDAIDGYVNKRYKGPLPAISAAVAVAGGLDALGLVDVPFIGAEDLNLEVLGLCGCSELAAVGYDFLLNTVLPEVLNQIRLHQFNEAVAQQAQQFALNAEEESFLDASTNVSNINTSELMTGGSGSLGVNCFFNCGDPADGEDDTTVVPNENLDPNDCIEVLVCPQGQVFDGATCSCKVECPTTSGFLHTSAFDEETLGLGLNTIANTDNFRDAAGAILAGTNCDTGKIFKNDQVNLLSTIVQTRSYIKADGSVGQSTYYPVEFTNCNGNQPNNQDYDPDKPCGDCDEGNPVKNPEIQPQTTDCGVQGGMFGYTRGALNGCNSDLHGGVDIKNEEGEPVYAMFNGVATLHEQAGGAGFFVKIKSQIGGDEIETNYFHLQQGQRVSGTVKAGDIIGYQGTSGNLANGIEEGSTESHVHIKMKKDGELIDPLPYFKTEFNPDTGEVTSSGCN